MSRSLISLLACLAVPIVAGTTVVGSAPAMRLAAAPQVVFERVDSTGNADVFVTNEKGKPQRDLTASTAADDSSPAFSPVSGRIAFATDRDGQFALWTMKADGSDQRRLRLPVRAGLAANPSYSPDGRWIAYACSTQGNSDICVVSSKGTGRRNLTHDAATELDPTWSADSKRVVFDRIVGRTSDIWTISRKGGTMLDITPGTALNELDPTLSKSGQLAFDAMDSKGNYDIYVTKPGSKRASHRTTDPAEDSAPVYSPDGRKLLFVSARTGDYEVFEMNSDGTGQRNISRSPSTADVAPNFGPPISRAFGGSFSPKSNAAAFPCGLTGTTGNDNGVDHPVLNGNGNANRLCGLAGADIVHGWAQDDLIDGGPGNDALYGDGGSDTIYARAGGAPDKDSIWGGLGSDTAFYDPGVDVCHKDVEHCRTTS